VTLDMRDCTAHQVWQVVDRLGRAPAGAETSIRVAAAPARLELMVA
jgi:hypothetical protein